MLSRIVLTKTSVFIDKFCVFHKIDNCYENVNKQKEAKNVNMLKSKPIRYTFIFNKKNKIRQQIQFNSI